MRASFANMNLGSWRKVASLLVYSQYEVCYSVVSKWKTVTSRISWVDFIWQCNEYIRQNGIGCHEMIPITVPSKHYIGSGRNNRKLCTTWISGFRFPRLRAKNFPVFGSRTFEICIELFVFLKCNIENHERAWRVVSFLVSWIGARGAVVDLFSRPGCCYLSMLSTIILSSARAAEFKVKQLERRVSFVLFDLFVE